MDSSAGGRPCLYTPAKGKLILNALKQGISYKLAAAYGGVSYDTLRRWRLKGELEDAPEELSQFCKAMKQAEGEAAFQLVSQISESAKKGDWRAAAWILERRHPKEWGKSAEHLEDDDDPWF